MRSMIKYTLAVAAVAAMVATADAQGQGRGGRGGAGGAGGGQPPGGGRGGAFQGGMMGGGGVTMLVQNTSVLEELKATAEQKESLAKWAQEAARAQGEKMREAMQGIDPQEMRTKLPEIMAKMSKEQMDEVAKVLKDDQTKRLKQIMVQQQGLNAFNTKDVADALKLTDEQKEAIRELATKMRTESNELRTEMGLPAFGGGAGGRGAGGAGGAGGRGAGGAGGAGGRGGPMVDPEKMAEFTKKNAEITKKYMEKAKGQLKEDQVKTWTEMTGKEFTIKMDPPRRRDN